jgi:hypothetical protein
MPALESAFVVLDISFTTWSPVWRPRSLSPSRGHLLPHRGRRDLAPRRPAVRPAVHLVQGEDEALERFRIARIALPEVRPAPQLQPSPDRRLLVPGSPRREVLDYRQTLGVGPTGGAMLYTSYDEDLRLHQPPLVRRSRLNEGDQSSPTREGLFFPVGGGRPFAYAFRIQVAPGAHRPILANGIHRAAAAATAGIDRIPLVLCDLSALELPEPLVETPKGMLLDPTFGPPMITDLNPVSISHNSLPSR